MSAFRRVLIANRGEIAVRIVRTLHTMDIEAVTVYSDADVTWPHVAMADRAIRLRGIFPAETYLNTNKIIEAAKISDCDAVHPGYGFLSESNEFSRACRDSGLKFIGPSPETLLVSGNKLECKRRAESAGVPVVPYTRESISDVEEAVKFSNGIGFPVLLKSAFGGGGRGIREARNSEEVRERFTSAQREAQASFGRFSIFIEKRLINPRHIEVQIIASDDSKEFVQLGERDCSIQRRYQKLIETSPSPVIDDEARRKLASYAITTAKSAGYSNAGTVEFLRDSESGNFYFMEINSRLQVEHPVTELVTGMDIVKTQIQVAAENTIPFSQNEVTMKGCAIECRINAEDVAQNFLPTTGRIDFIAIPGGPGIRVDTALQPGVEISPYYDSLVAKLLAFGENFDEARKRALVALSEFTISGIETTVPFHMAVLRNDRFARGEFDTGFLETTDLTKQLLPGLGDDQFIIAAYLVHSKSQLLEEGIKSRNTARDRPAWISSQKNGRFIDGL
ncbi:MAG TPA: biotin carboxylase N-terminal domain-containing protein [Nitrososphaerales archaeon]|nr:biotin carboxylase N-terminal domain-containing protein [Nitrososphaerales archaeon]